ncbi:hypothetical protein D3C75_224330 [compost metagenome]
MQTVGELLELIKDMDPSTRLVGTCTIESGRSTSSVGDGELSVDFYETYTYTPSDDCDGFDEDLELNDEGEVEIHNVLVFQVEGQETNFQ